MFCVRCQEIIGCIQILPSLIQVCGYHRLISRRRQIIYKEIPAVRLAVICKCGRSFYRAVSALADVTLNSCPLCGVIVPPVFRLCALHNNLLRIALCNVIGLSVCLQNICINPSCASAFQHFTAEIPCILCKVCGYAIHDVLSAVFLGLRFIQINLRCPVYDESSMISVIIRNPCCLRSPHHSHVLLLNTIFQSHVKLPDIAPCNEIF